MRIVIEQSGVKRVIEGSFEIIVSRADLETIIRRLCRARDGRGEDEEPRNGGGFHYGVIKIFDEPPFQVTPGPPRPWKES